MSEFSNSDWLQIEEDALSGDRYAVSALVGLSRSCREAIDKISCHRSDDAIIARAIAEVRHAADEWTND